MATIVEKIFSAHAGREVKAGELVMVEVTNGADAETVRGILQQRVDNAANDTAYPENAPAWKNNSAVTVNSNYVVMGVLPEGVTLPAAEVHPRRGLRYDYPPGTNFKTEESK